MSCLLFALLLGLSASPEQETTATLADPPKNITVDIHPDGSIIVGRDTVTLDNLAAILQQRLWKSYLGTGRMYDSIIVKLSGEVLMGVRGAALDAIKEGQEKALRELCVSKYKKPYESLSASRQKQVKRQFPVLFQELHW